MSEKKVIFEKNTKLSVFLACMFIIVITAVATAVLFDVRNSAMYGNLYNSFELNEIADKSIEVKSNIDLIDTEKKERDIKAATDSVAPVFSYNMVTTLSAVEDFKKFAEEVSLGYDKGVNVNSTVINLAYDMVNTIMTEGFFDYAQIDELKAQGYKEVSIFNVGKQNIVASIPVDEVHTALNLDSYVRENLNFSSVSAHELAEISTLVETFCVPNTSYDETLTLNLRRQAISEVQDSYIHLNKGDTVIARDSVVTAESLRILKLLSEQKALYARDVIADFVFYLITIGATMFLLYNELKNNVRCTSIFFVITAFCLISFALCIGSMFAAKKLGFEFGVEFIPFLLLPLFMICMFSEKKTALYCALLSSFLFSRLPGVDFTVFLFFAVVTVSCVLYINRLRRRLHLIACWLVSLLISCSFIMLFFALSSNVSAGVEKSLLILVLNITGTNILISICLPLVELIMNYPTISKLDELSDTSSGILSRLSMAAPGSFSHSLAVSELAQSGARAIGANEFICKVAGLYHDIGKIEHPEYFIENQSGENKHDDLSPSLSATIIRNHVKIGEQKARDARLPKEIIEIIVSHHGNDIIEFFYNEALKESGKENFTKEEVSKSDYSYKNPIPSSKEAGVIMIADSIEAASRTVSVSETSYRKLISSIIMKKVQHGQLDNCNLTMKELNVLTEVFIKYLLAKNHSRIKYDNN